MKVLTKARRDAILAAAKAVFEEVGFEQATMSEITARVGGSKATLYRYFESKEALFMELVNQTAEEHGGEVMDLLRCCTGMSDSGLPPEATEILALLDPSEDVNVNLRNFGERVIKTFLTPQKTAIKRMVVAAAGNNPELGRLFYENGPRRGTRYFEQYFEAAIEAGKLRQASPRAAAIHFRALLESEWTEPRLFEIPVDFSDAAIAASVERAVDVFMRAYGPEPARGKIS